MSPAQKKFTLKSSDNETFEVEEAVAVMSQTIKHMIEDGCADNTIPLPDVKGKILAKVIEYCNKHVKSSGGSKKDRPILRELKDWETDFLKVNQGTLFDLFKAANKLKIHSLLDLTCLSLAYMIKGKTPEQIRQILNIKNSNTVDEEVVPRNHAFE